MPPNSVGRLSSLAAIRELTAARMRRKMLATGRGLLSGAIGYRGLLPFGVATPGVQQRAAPLTRTAFATASRSRGGRWRYCRRSVKRCPQS
jgi:hypothetical protein